MQQCCARSGPGAPPRLTRRATTPSAPPAAKGTAANDVNDAANYVKDAAAVDYPLAANDAADWSETSSFEHVRQPRWSRGSSVASSASIIRESRAASAERPSAIPGLDPEPGPQHPALGIVASDTSHQPAGMTDVEI